MAKRPVVRKGRKNPNATVKPLAENQSVKRDIVMPVTETATESKPDHEVRIFPMSGAVDRTAEFERRRALDRKLDAILGKGEDADSSDELPVKPVETVQAGAGQVGGKRKDAVRKETIQKDLVQADTVRADEDTAPEVTESGSVLFDAVLPKGSGYAPGRHKGVRRANTTAAHAGKEAPLLEESVPVGTSQEDEEIPADEAAVTATDVSTAKDATAKNAAARNATARNAGQERTDKAAGGGQSLSIYDHKREREAQEKRIEAEVARRVSQAETALEPQVIISPRAVKRSRMTMLFIALGGVALALISIILGINYDRMNRTLAEANQELGFYKSLMSGENIQATGQGDVAGSLGVTGGQVKKEDDVRRIYLTFDDGPSEVTVETLDILATYGVKATFFVNGKDDERSRYIYNRIVDEGHTLAMHGYSHDFDTIYASVESFSEDLHKLRNLLYDKTDGRVWCTYYRFPGGSSTTTAKTDMKELAAYLEREGITYFDWNVYGGDDIPAATIISNIKANTTKYKNVMILLHDAADKKATVEALPGIIEYLQGLEDAVLLPVTEDTTAIQHGIQ